MDIPIKEPWPRVMFKTQEGRVLDGYVYHMLGDSFYISETSGEDRRNMSQNWVIHWRNIIKFYDAKYGLTCTCDAKGAENACHQLTCKWQTINTHLFNA